MIYLQKILEGGRGRVVAVKLLKSSWKEHEDYSPPT